MFNTIKQDIKVVFSRDPAARSIIETLLTCPGLHAILWHRLNHWLWKKNLFLLARISAHISRFLTGIEIHPGAAVGRGFFIDHGMGIVIGETSEIGDNCSIYHGVTLGGTTWNKGKRHPTLEDEVVVGAGAKILGPITVGEAARIGSNAVVIKNVPARSTVVGIPGRVITKEKKRRPSADPTGFDAYASKNMSDPIASAIDQMRKQINQANKEIAELEKQLRNLKQ